MAQTKNLVAPERKGVTRWCFDPSNQGAIHGGLFFNKRTGEWRDRGHKKYDPVAVLVDVDGCGNQGYQQAFVSAPYDGYTRDLPKEKRYFKHGEEIATFEGGYVYHWRFHAKEEKRWARMRAVFFHKHPRVLYGLHLAIAVLVGILGCLLTLIDLMLPTIAGVLMTIGAMIYAFFVSPLAILGKEPGKRFVEGLLESTQLWKVLYGLFGFWVIIAVGHEVVFGDGFTPFAVYGGLVSLVAIDSMFTGSWCNGYLVGKFANFLKNRSIRKKQEKNGANA